MYPFIHPGLGARLFLQSGRRRSAAAGGGQSPGLPGLGSVTGPQPGKKHENIMVSRRAHTKYQRWSFNQSLIWFYCRGIDEIVMGKDNYINYIVLMDLTFGNQTWLAGKSSSMEAFCGKFNGKTRGFSGSPCGKKGDKLLQL